MVTLHNYDEATNDDDNDGEDDGDEEAA